MFIDIVVWWFDGMFVMYKLLLENFEQYCDVVVVGICYLFGFVVGELIMFVQVDMVKMGMMVVINVLFECKGECIVLVMMCGFCDVLCIVYQNWLCLFDFDIVLFDVLYEMVVEIDECVGVYGDVVVLFDVQGVEVLLCCVFDSGVCVFVIVLIYGYCYIVYEWMLVEFVCCIGFMQVLVLYEVLLLMKMVLCGDMIVVDVYLLLILCCYVEQVVYEMLGVNLQFMQSSGGFMCVDVFQGKDVILLGLVGGIVGMVCVVCVVGFEQVIGFDMGGMLIDVLYYNGEFECEFEMQVVGVWMCVLMMSIYMVVVGGGLVFGFDGVWLCVGFELVGVNLGLVVYWCGGLLMVIDCNVMFGKIQFDYFLCVFGLYVDQLFDCDGVVVKFVVFVDEIYVVIGWCEMFEVFVEGFLEIVIGSMVNVIKKIFVQCGYDVLCYVLMMFGGVGGQYVCGVVDVFGMMQVFVYLFVGVLFVYGMGLVDQIVMCECVVEVVLFDVLLLVLNVVFDWFVDEVIGVLFEQGVVLEWIVIEWCVYLCYQGIDLVFDVLVGSVVVMQQVFEVVYWQCYVFLMFGMLLVVELVLVEVIGCLDVLVDIVLFVLCEVGVVL